ncbi:uncharacterized protein MYCFIDRAFT_84820 [Pseudocercospora fijiensis CIRAD86]|uniref:Uncharacterized protein n=1 Tax=Pseudocercospora fijiensis (strain CIRAD86) TaxID=383855 RepID=M2YJ09_PSEFD|nr:uncharacterized protein MYCFIDRAFT_84820 [Pseudocercospora fijiensis CIRAD86]EME77720.1 hypothetical protein MYCFIDRAFT_84820 [Pseudocercospora fijiensis CIRAD86]
MISKYRSAALIITACGISHGFIPTPKPNGALKVRNDCTAPCGYYNQWFTQECCSDNSVCITDAFTSANSANQHCDSDSANPNKSVANIKINHINDIGVRGSVWNTNNKFVDAGASSGYQ